ncbi:6827_t:CDS:2, partial [Cetraspora pellucida]
MQKPTNLTISIYSNSTNNSKANLQKTVQTLLVLLNTLNSAEGSKQICNEASELGTIDEVLISNLDVNIENNQEGQDQNKQTEHKQAEFNLITTSQRVEQTDKHTLRESLKAKKLSQISSLVLPYSIVADIRDQPANITFATALYYNAKVQGQIILLIVNSRSSESVISSHLLNDLVEILIDVIVTNASLYCVIVEITVTVKFRKLNKTPLNERHKVVVKKVGSKSRNSSSNNNYKDEELEEQLFAYFEYENKKE